MTGTTVSPALPTDSVLPCITPKGIMAWLTAPRSRYVLLQSLVGIALSYELLFGNESVVPRWVAELTVAWLLATILVIVAIPKRLVETGGFVAGLVGFDTLVAAGSVYLSGNAREDFYLSYFLMILIATSARSLVQMLGLSAVVCAGYGLLLAEGVLTTGELSAGQMMGVPVLLMMGVFYGLTLEELGAERRRADGLSHHLAELRLEEEHLLLTRDRLLHELSRLKSAVSAEKRGTSPAPPQAGARSTRTGGLGADSAGGSPSRWYMERLASQMAAMLHDLARQMGRETGALRAKIRRDDSLAKHVEHIFLAGERTATMAAQLEGLIWPELPKREIGSLNAMLAELEPTLREMLPDGIALALDLDSESCFVEGAPGHLEYVVIQLVLNARDSMAGGGQLVLATRTGEEVGSSDRPSPVVRLAARDTGCGMTFDTQARLLEPFFTTKPRGGAWGMGLTKVESMVARLGGAMAITSQPGRGTEVVVTLPRRDPPGRGKVSAGIEPSLSAGGMETVLVVEADEALRKWTLASLRRARYQVLEAQSGVEALLLAHRYTGSIQLVLGNLVMADMTGDELAERLLSHRPSLRALFTASYPEDSIRSHRIAARYYLQKPYQQDELLRKVRDVLDAV